MTKLRKRLFILKMTHFLKNNKILLFYQSQNAYQSIDRLCKVQPARVDCSESYLVNRTMQIRNKLARKCLFNLSMSRLTLRQPTSLPAFTRLLISNKFSWRESIAHGMLSTAYLPTALFQGPILAVPALVDAQVDAKSTGTIRLCFAGAQPRSLGCAEHNLHLIGGIYNGTVLNPLQLHRLANLNPIQTKKTQLVIFLRTRLCSAVAQPAHMLQSLLGLRHSRRDGIDMLGLRATQPKGGAFKKISCLPIGNMSTSLFCWGYLLSTLIAVLHARSKSAHL